MKAKYHKTIVSGQVFHLLECPHCKWFTAINSRKVNKVHDCYHCGQRFIEPQWGESWGIEPRMGNPG